MKPQGQLADDHSASEIRAMSSVFPITRPLTSSSIRATAFVPTRPSIDSRELLQGGRELIIRHGDQEYRLRHTQNDKLILTK